MGVELVAWHRLVPPFGALGAAASPWTVTAVVTSAEVPLHPTELTPIVAAPENPADQFTVPVVLVPLMVPAVEGLIYQT